MNDQNLDNTQEQDGGSESYSLYTEKIVKNPWNRTKKVIKNVAKIVGSAVLFGGVASVVMIALVPAGKRLMGFEQPDVKINVTIPTDTAQVDYTINETEEDTEGYYIIGSGDEIIVGDEILSAEEWAKLMDERIKYNLGKYKPGTNELDSMYFQLRTNITEFKQSTVTIRSSDDGEHWDYLTQSSFFGFIVAEDENHFYIITHHVEGEGKYLAGFFYNGSVAILDYLSEDTTTGMVVYSADKSDFDNLDVGAVRCAVLGNSYMVQQGAVMVAYGNIYGQSDMLVYTNACSISGTLMDTDSNYRVLCTDIAGNAGDCGVLLNVTGEVVGIIIRNNENASAQIMTAYAISELKPLIQHMINGKVTPYVGVLPQTVSAAMKNTYDMPAGVYVYNVEEGSPAYKAGIQIGDVITQINDTVLTSVKDFTDAIMFAEVGDMMHYTISRPAKEGYREIVIDMTLVGQ